MRRQPHTGIRFWLLILVAAAVLVSRLFDIGPSAGEPVPEPDTYRMARVIDGDSIEVFDDREKLTVRLLGIDAPERNQPHGPEAGRFLHSMITGKTLRLTREGKDRHGRTLAHVHADEEWVNLVLVRQGAAWAYRARKDGFSAKLRAAENEARSAGVGLWAGGSPVYPGDWRRR